MKIGLDWCIQQNGGACIDKIEDFNNMLLLACRIRGDAGNVFEIHLDFFERLGTLDGLALAAPVVRDAIVSGQDLPNGACGTG